MWMLKGGMRSDTAVRPIRIEALEQQDFVAVHVRIVIPAVALAKRHVGNLAHAIGKVEVAGDEVVRLHAGRVADCERHGPERPANRAPDVDLQDAMPQQPVGGP